MKHFTLGAMNKETENYEYPQIASKKSNYKCPDCNNDVLFRKGIINKPHFAHVKSDTPCTYYEHPSESQIHKDGKLLIYNLLKLRTPIHMVRECEICHKSKSSGSIEYATRCKPIIEHSFMYNEKQKKADVALIENKGNDYIFEIYNTHKTRETDRPEPWFEINANVLIKEMNKYPDYNTKGELLIKCIREHTCKKCIIEKENKRLMRIERHNKMIKKMEQEKIRELEQIKQDQIIKGCLKQQH